MQPGGYPPQPPGYPQQPYGAPPPYGAQQPYGGPPQYGGPQPHMMPAPRKSRAGCIIAAVVVVLIAIAGIGGIVALAIGATAPARDAGHAFLQKLRAHDYDGAV